MAPATSGATLVSAGSSVTGGVEGFAAEALSILADLFVGASDVCAGVVDAFGGAGVTDEAVFAGDLYACIGFAGAVVAVHTVGALGFGAGVGFACAVDAGFVVFAGDACAAFDAVAITAELAGGA